MVRRSKKIGCSESQPQKLSGAQQAAYWSIGGGGVCGFLESKSHLKIFTFKGFKNLVLVEGNMPVC